MLTLLVILLIPIAAIAFIFAAFAVCGKAFLWVFRLLYELGKVAFILFIVWIILVSI